MPYKTIETKGLTFRGTTPVSYTHLDVYKRQSHSSLLLRLITACETSRDKPASLSSSTCLIYAHELRLPLGLYCSLPAYPPCTPYIRFLFVRLRFRYPFFSPVPRDTNLGSCYGVRRQLRPSWTFTTDWRHARHTKKKPGNLRAYNLTFLCFFSLP